MTVVTVVTVETGQMLRSWRTGSGSERNPCWPLVTSTEPTFQILMRRGRCQCWQHIYRRQRTHNQAQRWPSED